MSRVLSVCAIASAAFVGFASTVFAAQDTLSEGRAVYVRANCVGCHKWHGDGGGGYGGAALSLRKTQLDKDEIMYTVMCGRPGTGMPFFRRDVYADDASASHPCDGLTRHDLGDVGVAEATIFLRPPEIEAVATYVLTAIKDKGEPNLQDCVAFFGETSRVCDTYKTGASHSMPQPLTTK